MTQSPFRKYEETYCNGCDDYNGCIGLVVKMSAGMGESVEDFGHKATNEWINSMQRSIGSSLFTSKYELISKCMNARKWVDGIVR